MKKTLILLAFAGLYTSCIVQGLTNDYNKLSETNKLKIVKPESFRDLNREYIYKINGQQLGE